MIKLVIVDFDDTLCASEEVCFRIENITAEILGLSPVTRDLHKKTWGMSLRDAVPVRFPGADVEKYLKEIYAIHKEFIARGELDSITDENYHTLQKIKSMGKRLAILTARSLKETEHLLHADHPVSKHFEKIYHAENLPFKKPNPKVFDEILTHFGVAAHETVYIGDSVSDAQCAKNAGLHFIAVLESGLRSEEDFLKIPVDHFVKKFTEVVRYL